ncbi:unnamed protein product [Ilex paraguariensis]|uniref:Protein FLX-like 2 n=1 Tax=Ilex paraguariensis TaxID=185542 RepID=A0ABC8QN44_9AQUA
MGSKGRVPPPHLRHPDPFGSGIHSQACAFPPFDMLPPIEVMEQKLAAQHVEMQKLAKENQRLAATHGTLRKELAGAQHELHMVHAHIGSVKSEREHQMRGLLDKIGNLEAALQATEPIKMELQQARAAVQSLIAARKERTSEMQQVTQDLQRAHSAVQQIPGFMSELESLRQEYHHCRVTYAYEKKLYDDHLESLQVMEKNYVTMAREVEQLRVDLANSTNLDRTGGPCGDTYDNDDATGHYPVGQNAYDNSYGLSQGRDPLPGGGSGAGAGGGPHVRARSGVSPAMAGYDAQRVPSVPGYDVSRAPGNNAQRGPRYNAQMGPSHDMQRGSSYDPQKLPGYDGQRRPVYDAQRGSGYEAQRGPAYDVLRGPSYDKLKGAGAAGFDASSRGTVGLQGQAAPVNNVRYGSAARSTPTGSGYEAPPLHHEVEKPVPR